MAPLEDWDRPEIHYGNRELGHRSRDEYVPHLPSALDRAVHEVTRQTYTTINWRSPWIWGAALFGAGCYGLLIWLVVYVLMNG